MMKHEPMATAATTRPGDPVYAKPRGQKRSGDSVDRVFEHLVDDIMAGRLQPGEKIKEGLISKRLSVSRGPVREALRRIEERGLITREPNVGARVSAFSAADFLHMIQVREALEGMACRLAASNMTQAQIDSARAFLESRAAADRDEAPIDPDGGTDLDYRGIRLDFHHMIARDCGNPILTKLLCEDFYRTMRLWHRHQVQLPRRSHGDMEEHLKILQAIEDREPIFAEELMRRHIRMIRKRYVEAVEPKA